MSTWTWERRAVVLLLVAVVLLLAWGVSCAPRLETARSETDAGRVAPHEHRGQFSANGRLEVSLSPGVAGPIDVQVENLHAETLEVRRLLVTITEVTAPRAGARRGCDLSDFEVDQGDLPGFEVPARQRVRLSDTDIPRDRWPRLGMVRGAHNQDGCKDAGLVLGFEVDGTPT